MYEAVLSLRRQYHAPVHRGGGSDARSAAGPWDVPGQGLPPTTLKTVMGEVGYQRHVYLLSGAAEQPRATVYLLDRSMGLDTVGLFSDTVCMMAVEAACAVSHRTAAATLNDLTG